MQQYFEKKLKIRYNFINELNIWEGLDASDRYVNHGHCTIYYFYIINCVSNFFKKQA